MSKRTFLDPENLHKKFDCNTHKHTSVYDKYECTVCQVGVVITVRQCVYKGVKLMDKCHKILSISVIYRLLWPSIIYSSGLHKYRSG